jgi:chloride channel protein, CIC family
VPRPMIPRRIASGRGATEQPNACGDGEAALTRRFWAAVVLTGVAAGLFGVAMMALLTAVEHIGFGYDSGSFQSGVEQASGVRRAVALLVAGVIGGVGWHLLRRFTAGQRAEADEAAWFGADLSWQRSLGTSVLSEIVVGLGASLGREAAPKLMGALSGSVVARWSGLDAGQRRLLVACGAGSGLAAVYNVPLAGALFTAEIMIGVITLPVALPALACSGIATMTAWIYLPAQAVYVGVPDYPTTGSALVWAVVAGPAIGLVAVAFIRLVAVVSHHRARGRMVLVAPLGAFGVLAGIGQFFPQLFGNGKGIALDAFLGSGGVLLLLALFLLKPLVTALCLGSSASGGLLTPTLATGAALGGFLGSAWSLLWPGTPVGVFALVGAAAMLGAGMQAPLTALVLVLELTHAGFNLAAPLVVATVLATAVARRVDGYSIYSGRLSALQPPDGGTRLWPVPVSWGRGIRPRRERRRNRLGRGG